MEHLLATSFARGGQSLPFYQQPRQHLPGRHRPSESLDARHHSGHHHHNPEDQPGSALGLDAFPVGNQGCTKQLPRQTFSEDTQRDRNTASLLGGRLRRFETENKWLEQSDHAYVPTPGALHLARFGAPVVKSPLREANVSAVAQGQRGYLGRDVRC